MTQEELKNLIGYKEDRVAVLQTKKQSLVDLESEISKSKLARTMQTAFYNIKRFFLLFVTVILLLTGIIGLVYPDLLFLNSSKYKSDFVEDFKTQYQNETSKALEISFKEAQGNSNYNIKTLERNIDDAITEIAVKNAHFSIRIIAFILLCLAGFLWYISKLTKKLKESDEVISKVIVTNKEIIKDYELIIDEENREISDLKKNLV
ncbi:hypothetical protein [Flavobacterium okayamense]|uniref:Uncharacterized protein n=1 Tax=Flavobacterium okayamense TaxID=2830782 RepID=A0ABN6HXN6_9FLAO|nr:hypothetical protein [Flavobacterium okayamense]BCY29154.1 hypothetical protein KK2020170_20220 [Flavobacterium okayamense]